MSESISAPSASGNPGAHPFLHEVLVVVVQVRGQRAHVLLWRHGLGPTEGRWALPGGVIAVDEDLPSSALRQLAEKVDVRAVSHLKQVAVFSDPRRVPGRRVIASAFLGLLPVGEEPRLPEDTAWWPVEALPDAVADHAVIVERARQRLAAKLSYSNLGFALAPAEFTLSELAHVYAAALGHQVDPTNLQRVLSRRGELERCGRSVPSGPTGGRPAALFRFREKSLRITDQFAALRPPTGSTRGRPSS